MKGKETNKKKRSFLSNLCTNV